MQKVNLAVPCPSAILSSRTLAHLLHQLLHQRGRKPPAKSHTQPRTRFGEFGAHRANTLSHHTQRRTTASKRPRIHTAEVAGSKPASPTFKCPANRKKRNRCFLVDSDFVQQPSG